jgi:adenine deaminase
MKSIEGIIVDVINRSTFKGRVFFNDVIKTIQRDDSIESSKIILPGFVDSHVHIESSMLSPVEYSRKAIQYGVLSALADPHEIANVCGKEGVRFMIENANKTPMKINFAAPSCVPATSFETSGAVLEPNDIRELFESNECFHLGEMMNFPGVIYDDSQVLEKLNIAKKYNKTVDGHAPLLSGNDLKKYFDAGISTDHECTNIDEALEKIKLGMKIMIRKSSATNDYLVLHPLIQTHPESVMLCSDDCHPDDLQNGYINLMVKDALNKGYNIFDVISAASKNAVLHYTLDHGLLQIGDKADFITVNNLDELKILSCFINGIEIYNGNDIKFENPLNKPINNFYVNNIDLTSLHVKVKESTLNVIEVIDNSLLTKKYTHRIDTSKKYIQSNTDLDIIKIVVINRYSKSKPAVAFIKGFGLKSGAIASSIAHDSHNIVAVGVSDQSIISAINEINKNQGGLCVINDFSVKSLPLPIAGLMSNKSCDEVAPVYKQLTKMAHNMGCTLRSPFMTLAFMSLLVIPELKLGDKGLFDVNKFQFVPIQE